MNMAYVVEVNAISIILIIIMLNAVKRSFASMSNEMMYFKDILYVTLAYSVSDIFVYTLDGVAGTWNYYLLQFVNIIHILSIIYISFVWVLYVLVFSGVHVKKKTVVLIGIPTLLSALFVITNPITNLVFNIEEGANAYSRNSGIFVTWAVMWGYILFGFVYSFILLIKAPNKVVRKQYKPLVSFIIFPAIASITQILVYGISTSQAGVTIGLFTIFITLTGNAVVSDKLTGINNRSGMGNYLVNLFDGEKKKMTVFMLDLNDFKQVNDKFGHAVGDVALKVASDVLKQSLKTINERLFLCRFGGDEFVIVGRNITEYTVEKIKNDIIENSKNVSKSGKYPFTIEFSVGVATDEVYSYEEFEKLLNLADEKMYSEKKRMKNDRIAQQNIEKMKNND